MRRPANPPACHCGAPARLVPATDIYGPNVDQPDRNFWACRDYPECNSYVGTHRESPIAAPVGTLADTETRALRRRVHKFFDMLWNRPDAKCTRQGAYRILERIMGAQKGYAHVGWMDAAECRTAITRLRDHLGISNLNEQEQ